MTVTALPRLDAAVVVPGFLSGASDFREMADSLSARGIRTAVVPMAAWHWLPCLGGRSMRPILERIDHTVRHLAAAEGDPAAVPGFEYSWQDCLTDFVHTPGGIWEVGGSAEVQEYPIVEPRGHFPEAGAARGRVALIGHSAGGWISRVYLSKRRASMALVPPSSALPPAHTGAAARPGGTAAEPTTARSWSTPSSRWARRWQTRLGALPPQLPPEAWGPRDITAATRQRRPAFRGVAWANQEPPPSTVRCLAVGATGTPGGSSGRLTRDAYSFCVDGGDGAFGIARAGRAGREVDGQSLLRLPVGTKLDGDGVTPTFSALSLPGAETCARDTSRDSTLPLRRRQQRGFPRLQACARRGDALPVGGRAWCGAGGAGLGQGAPRGEAVVRVPVCDGAVGGLATSGVRAAVSVASCGGRADELGRSCSEELRRRRARMVERFASTRSAMNGGDESGVICICED